jgi:hypothetical protein
MAEEFSPDLWIAALVVFVCAWLVAQSCVSRFAAAILAVIKVSIPLVYFAAFRNEQWNFVDDLFYTRLGTELLNRGFSPLSILRDHNGIETMVSAANGWHIGYIWMNVLAQYLFGEHYYAPVFLNVSLTFVAAWLLYRIAALADFSAAYRRALFCYILFQPELLMWSSLINLKDILVMTLTIGLCYSSLMLAKRLSVLHFLLFIGYVISLRFLRFYVPLVFLAALGTWYVSIFVKTETARRYLWRYAIPIAALLALALTIPSVRDKVADLVAGLGIANISYYREEFLQFSLYGCLRWLTTPRPWALSADTSFLLIPSMWHWATLIPALVGAAHFWRSGKAAKLCLIYLAVAVVLYGAFELEQSPRHRLQVTFVIAWLQFHALWIVTHRSSTKSVRAQLRWKVLPNEGVAYHHRVVTRRCRDDARPAIVPS